MADTICTQTEFETFMKERFDYIDRKNDAPLYHAMYEAYLRGYKDASVRCVNDLKQAAEKINYGYDQG